MKWKQRIKQTHKGAAIGALLAVFAGLIFLPYDFPWGKKQIHIDPPFGDGLIHASYDLPFLYRKQVAVPDDVILVYLDDDSFRNLGQPYVGPWDRSLYARLVERLTAEKAAGVTFDIIFSDANKYFPEGDERFAKAIAANGRVILAGDYQLAGNAGMGGHTLIRALPDFADGAAGTGLVQFDPDQDFVVRHPDHVPIGEDVDDRLSSLSWKLASLVGAESTKDSNQRYLKRWNNYYGPPGAIPNLSFQVALETNGFCPAGYFSNKIVIVGSSLKTAAANERKDELRTPYTRHGFGPAVDIHATQTLNLLHGDWLTRTTYRTEIILIVLAGIVFGFGFAIVRPFPAMGFAALSAAGVSVIAVLIFQNERIWFPWMIIVAAQIPVALLWSVVFNSVRLFVQNQLYEHSLRLYLPPKLVKKFSHDRTMLTVNSVEHKLTLLFSDIADFTTISEGMNGHELANLMNAYFHRAVGSCIHKTEGTVVKFIGDAIFAFWNAPDQQPDHAFLACEAALNFRKMNDVEIRGRRLLTRIGLHTGVAKVGNFGSEERVDYTAMGENVNLAARLEGLNKYLGTQCLISGQTHAELGDKLVTRPLGLFRLKGFEALVDVYELVGWPEQAEETKKWRELFAGALRNYQEKNLEFAEIGFQQVLELKPGDGPSEFYLKQIEARAAEAASETWNTHTIIKEK